MKRALIATVLMGVMGVGSAVAQDGWYDRHRDRDIRNDYRDINRDQRAIEHDRWELRRDLREGRFGAAERERAEIRGRQRDLYRDYRDVNHDRRDRDWGRY